MHSLDYIKAANEAVGKAKAAERKLANLEAAYRDMETAYFAYQMAQNDDTVGQGAAERISEASRDWQAKSAAFRMLCEEYFG